MKHRFYIERDQLSGEEVRFSEAQAHQLGAVLRLRAGDQVSVFDGVTQQDFVVELTAPARGRVIGERAHGAEPRTRLVVYPALLQRDKFETVLQKLTEVGASSIAPVITARSLVREAPDDRRVQRWHAILREATEQSGRGSIPELRGGRTFAEALADARGTILVAYEGEREGQLRDALAARPLSVSLFIGPEGGYTAEEVDCARRAGAHLVTLGPRVLRAETASPLLAALVLYELGDLS